LAARRPAFAPQLSDQAEGASGPLAPRPWEVVPKSAPRTASPTAAPAGGEHGAPAAAELLEREPPLRCLALALREAAAGQGRIALVCGEAGIGKTSLVESFMAAHRGEARMLVGRCDALFTPEPLGPLHDIALQTGGALLQLMRTAAAGRLAIFAALLAELYGGGAPTVLVFEDVHWADEATLDLLKYLGRRVRAARALVILTYRDEELDATHRLWSVLGNLPADEVRRVPVQPLSEAAVADLARRAGRPAERVHAQTGGNPFYVTELLASPAGSVPATVREATLARAMRLSPEARDLVELISVVPSRAERWLLGEAAEARVDECVASGLIVQQDEVLAFRHELARRAVERALPAARRRALHEAVLRRLIGRSEGPAATARLVHHATRAGDGDAARRWAPQAARQAAALGAHYEAAVHYQTAIDHVPLDDVEARAALLEERAYECSLIDRLAEATTARETALALRRQQGNLLKAGDNLRWLSRLAWFRGRGEEARQLAMHAVTALEALPAGPELAMAYSNMAQLHMLGEDGPAATEWGRRALELAERFGRTEIVVHALNNLGAAGLQMGDPEGRAKLERSLDLALANGLHEHAARAYTNLTYFALIARDYCEMAKRTAAGLAYTRGRDLDSWAPYLLALRACGYLGQGLWREAAEDAHAALRAPSAVTRVTASVVLGLVRLRRDEEGAEALLDEARTLALAAGDIMRIGPMAAARAEAAWLRGDTAGIAEEVQAAYELALERPEPWRLGELSLWLWRAGALDRPPEAVALPYRLEMSGDWRAAAAEWKHIGCPYNQALALLEGDRAARLQALDTFDRLGAAAAAALVRRRLRAEGVGSVPRGPRAATKTNPLGLTGRQVDILRLLAANLSNKEIAARLDLSPKTVDHHVSAILSKLDVATRKQAAMHAITGALLAEASAP
jgi:DNA-binding CsgD family transcriptional regulator